MQNFKSNRPLSRKEVKSRLTYAAEDDPKYRKALIKTIEMLTGRARLEKLYLDMKAMELTADSIWDVALNKLDITAHYDKQKFSCIPKNGPLIFIANHPFGVIDGLLLGYLLAQVRSEFGILVNEALCGEELFDPYFLPIDFRGTKQATQTIIQTRKESLKRLAEGQSIGIFPSGGVATSFKPFGKVKDLEWKRFVVKLVQQSKATVIPLFFHGHNSPIFHWASRVNEALRLSLLLHEARNKMGSHIGISIGDPIEYQTLADLGKVDDWLEFLYNATWSMQSDAIYSQFRRFKMPKNYSQ